jgi:hypothetical protein
VSVSNVGGSSPRICPKQMADCNGVPEAVLVILSEHDKVRDVLLRARDQIAYAKSDR